MQKASGISNTQGQFSGTVYPMNNDTVPRPAYSEGRYAGYNDRPKKKIYQKWWFWVAVVLLLVFFYGLGTKDDSVAEQDPSGTESIAKDASDAEESDMITKEEANDSAGKTAEKIEGPAPDSGTNMQVTPLSDFWVLLKDDHTITLREFETHDETCIIPSEYIVDGETWPVTRIGEACFFGRTSLEYLVIPEGVESIEHNAFNSCAIETFYFPSTLKDITGIFEYLDSGGKKTIYYAGDADDWWAIEGADELPDNIELFGNTPVPAAADDTNYLSADLTT